MIPNDGTPLSSVGDELSQWLGDNTETTLDGVAETESRDWSGRTRIYLEGPTDYEVIAIRWFNSDSIIDFKGAQNDNEGGCSWVIKQVSDQEGSYGVVDRDVLLRPEHYDLFFETNDDLFKDNNPHKPQLLILGRHEVENYLLDVAALFKIINNRNKKLDNRIQIVSPDQLAEALLSIADTIVTIDCISCVFRVQQLPLPTSLKNTRFHVGDEPNRILGEIDTLFNKWLEEAELRVDINKDNLLSCLKGCHSDLQKLYENFYQSEESSPIKRLTSLLRVIDGKRLLGHIVHRFTFKDDIENDLADAVAIRDNIPAELTEFISKIKEESIRQ